MSSGSSSSFINSSTWSNCSSDNDPSILAKLRRLKIQEGVLLQNVHKTMLKHYDSGENVIIPCTSSEYKSYINNLRNSYSEIKNSFDSVKCNTTSHEALKSYDIDDIKNEVIDLETKIKKFKDFLLSEQTSLKAKELDITKQMDIRAEFSVKTIKQPKIKTKPFSDIVPSPVKNIISSPFKCQEVQQFQEFLKSYQRYGGWNEYSHNMFTQSWLKHFHKEFDSEDLEAEISKMLSSNSFMDEIFEKIPGVTKDDIIQHSKWYLEYLYLKRRQQEALNKWRAKKKIIKESQLREKGENKAIWKLDYHNVDYHNEERSRKYTKRVNDIGVGDANQHGNPNDLGELEPMMEPEPTQEPEPALEPESAPETMAEKPSALEATSTEQKSNGELAEPELDPELLEALGESTSGTPEFGEKIHESLAKLWLPLLVKGLPKDKKEKMLKDYLIPDNCRLLQAPKLNAEISAAVIDSVRNRDKILVVHQQQLGQGITAINRALNTLLSGDDKKIAIQHLSNACRILSDLHSINTNSRIKLITPNLDKNFLHVVKDSERDETLFGNKLSEKIKAAKAIERQGLQIKKSNPKPSGSQATTNRSSNSGNWSGPPRYSSNRGNRGGKKTTTQTRRPYSSSTQQQPASKPAAANKPHAQAPQ